MWTLGYLDPGAGYVFAQGPQGLWAWLLGGLAMLAGLPFRPRGRTLLLLLLAAILALGWGMYVMTRPAPVNTPKVVVIGLDGMDPKLCRRLMDEGRLPNLSKLAATGSFSPLGTTVPAESAVAWTSFATGLNPGRHGIFDFVMRDPDRHSLYLSLNEAVTGRDGRVQVRTRRQGQPFWAALSQRRIPCSVYFCPNTFPPEPVEGSMISGMGVPDVTGLSGSFTFYTAAGLRPEDRDTRGRVVPLRFEGDTAKAALYGPAVAGPGGARPLEVPLAISTRQGGVQLELGKSRLFLRVGEWSEWQSVSFSRGLFQAEHGIVRFYLKGIAPEVELYASPVNFDPRRPLLPISHPAGLAADLARRVGPFYTQGMPADIWALVEGRLDDPAFLDIVDEVTESRRRILDAALDSFQGGVLFFYFGALDDVQHMFWSTLDPANPLHDPASPHRDVIPASYARMDALVGHVLDRAGDALVIVLSDHGFASYRRAVHVNRWLVDAGYQALKPGAREEDPDPVDWSRTRAYAIGFGGVFLNLVGRECQGIVEEDEADALLREIRAGLEGLRDPETGERVVRTVYEQRQVYSGPRVERDAPDLLVGFEDGYRASWQTCLGRAPDGVVEVNRKKWSGDHMVDPALVPGVLFVNRRVPLSSPSILDLAPTILGLYGVSPEAPLDGRPLFDSTVLPGR